MKGINFEEWKALVKKNRQALNTKSNTYRSEPESLTWGAEKAVKTPEYGQIHTITYNVTGMEVPSDWPTEIMSTKTLSLSIPEGYAISSVDVNVDYEQGEDSITINNVQKDLSITLIVIDTNGHEYVDLGLPSGTLWATMNVGATSPTEYGDYYMYGMGSKTYDSTDTPYDGTEDPLDLSKDTARQVWGGDWHMPTRTQIQELIANTTYQWVTDYNSSGINGCTFTATNGAVLFIPAAGFWYDGSQSDVGNYGSYWGSSPNSSYGAYLLVFDDGYKDVDSFGRENGYSVRPVVG